MLEFASLPRPRRRGRPERQVGTGCPTKKRSSSLCHVGMCAQQGLIWSRVDLVRKLITVPNSKNGNTRHIPSNSVALAAFQELFARSSGQGRVFVNMQGEPLKGYKCVVRDAGISFFTWYCLRHTFASRLVI